MVQGRGRASTAAVSRGGCIYQLTLEVVALTGIDVQVSILHSLTVFGGFGWFGCVGDIAIGRSQLFLTSS